MAWHSFIAFTAALAPLAAVLAGPAAATEALRISGPAVHENLAVYFIHGPSAPGPVPLTLKEAIAAGSVTVHETGNVNRLTIENTGAAEVFVQAGDIVKGGQQDRVLTISLLVPSRSGAIDIGAYCVEQGRWSARGAEDVRRFASADKTLPSKAAKLALLAPVKPRAAQLQPSVPVTPLPEGLATRSRTIGGNDVQQRAGAIDTGSRQSQVWSSVATAQRNLSESLGAPVAAPASASSLQLSLENERLAAARRAFIAALEPAASADDVVGYVFAIGGQLNSGDMYGSTGLFRKMWAKQLEGAATEAVAEKRNASAPLPTIADVRAFMERAAAGAPDRAELAGNLVIRETRDTEQAVLAETRRPAGTLVHRAYVAK